MDDRARWWWALPGPSLFASSIVDDVDAGRSVLLELPPPGVDGLTRQVRALLHEHGSMRTVKEVEGTSSPTDALETLAGDVAHDGVEAALRSLSRSELVLWVRGCTSVQWNEWRSVIEVASRLAGELPLGSRLVLAIEVPAGERLPAQDVAVRRHRWEGQVDQDMLTWWCRQLLANDVREPMTVKRLRTAMTAHIAVWDGELAADLLTEVHLPAARQDILVAAAKRRGWKRGMPASWQIGAQMLIDQRPVVHSAWLAESQRWDDIDRRIWSAQASVLLPVLDDMRMKIIRLHQRSLPTGLRDSTGQVMPIEDYELGFLRYLMLNRGWKPQTSHYASVIQRAWGLRNQLAHLKPVEWIEADTLLRAGI